MGTPPLPVMKVRTFWQLKADGMSTKVAATRAGFSAPRSVFLVRSGISLPLNVLLDRAFGRLLVIWAEARRPFHELNATPCHKVVDRMTRYVILLHLPNSRTGEKPGMRWPRPLVTCRLR